MGAQVHRAAQAVPVHLAVPHEQPDVDGTEVTHIVRQQRLLATRIGGLVAAQVRHGVVLVRPIDEVHSRLPRLPGAVHDLRKHLPGVEPALHLSRPGMHQRVVSPRFHRAHELVGHGHRDVEIRDLGDVVLAGDELENIRVVDPQDAHVGAPPRPALLHDLGAGVVERHEGDRPRRHPHGGADHVVLRPEPGEPEAGAPARLVYQRHVPQGVVDAVLPVGQRVFHGQHKARRKLPQGTAGIHERGTVGHPGAGDHELVKRLGQRVHGPGTGSVEPIGFGDGPGHPPEQLPGRLDGVAAVVLDEIAALQHRHGVLAQREGDLLLELGRNTHSLLPRWHGSQRPGQRTEPIEI